MAEPIPFEMNETLALHRVRELAADTAKIVITNHCKDRQRERGITRRQVEQCLIKGTITEGPSRTPHGDWKLSLFRHAAGEELTCVVVIDWPKKLIVVTAYKG